MSKDPKQLVLPLPIYVDAWIGSFSNGNQNEFEKGLDHILRVISLNIDNPDQYAAIRKQWVRAMVELLVHDMDPKEKKKLLKLIQNKVRSLYKKNNLDKFFNTDIYRHSFQSSMQHKLRNVGKRIKNEPVPWDILYFQLIDDINDQGTFQVQQRGDLKVIKTTKPVRKVSVPKILSTVPQSRPHSSVRNNSVVLVPSTTRRSSIRTPSVRTIVSKLTIPSKYIKDHFLNEPVFRKKAEWYLKKNPSATLDFTKPPQIIFATAA